MSTTTPETITYPDRVELARLPTPLVHLPHMGESLGVSLYCKRDDLTGIELSGNKVRKLEYLLADARAQGADTVITCGGEQSNHARATALAATRLGLRSHVLLRTVDPANPPADTGNILLDRLAGAEIQWITMAEWRERDALMNAAADRYRKRGHKPYIVPMGGSNAIGCWGYVRAMEELVADLRALSTNGPDDGPDDGPDGALAPTTIIYAAGSGGTGAGLILGARMLGLLGAPLRIVGFCVCDDREYFVNEIYRLCTEFEDRYSSLIGRPLGIERTDIEIVEGYVGVGYDKSQPVEREVARELASREAIILDPTYTGKAFYGLTRELAADRGQFGERIVFLHTGGIFGLLR